MSLEPFRLPKLLFERRISALYGLLLIILVWGGVFHKFSGDLEGDRKDAERSNQNIAMVLEESVLRLVGELDKALLYMRRSIETRQGSSDYGTIVNTTDVLSDIIVQVAVIDAQGVMRASNAGPQPAPAMDLSK